MLIGYKVGGFVVIEGGLQVDVNGVLVLQLLLLLWVMYVL